MTPWQVVYAAGVVAWKVLELLVRLAVILVVGAGFVVVFLLFVLWGMTRDGRQAEWRTRPQR